MWRTIDWRLTTLIQESIFISGRLWLMSKTAMYVMNYIGTRIVFIRPPAPESPLFILAPTNDEAAKRQNEQLNARQRIRIGGIALSRLFRLFSAACAIAKGSIYRHRAWSLASNMSWEIRLWRIYLYLFGHQSFLFGCLLLLVAVALSSVAQVFFCLHSLLRTVSNEHLFMFPHSLIFISKFNLLEDERKLYRVYLCVSV